jgi:hypothetical protein
VPPTSVPAFPIKTRCLSAMSPLSPPFKPITARSRPPALLHTGYQSVSFIMSHQLASAASVLITIECWSAPLHRVAFCMLLSRLPAHLLAHIPIYPSVRLPVCLPAYPPTRLFIYLSFTYLSTCLPIYPLFSFKPSISALTPHN